MKFKYLVVLILCFSAQVIFAQITGVIKDESQDDALEYATLALYKQDDKSVVTNEQRVFKIDYAKQENYFIMSKVLLLQDQMNFIPIPIMYTRLIWYP
ncbi:hypothetical protein [Aestuariibaculum suncheonense]|uniref:Uncharacterized protein n=1 Tax=Aestuariibaculum suncheonense TaxID=1028745 RepID=A0A8J6QBU1_9FLAO|nr:hypothetical protein [Aestuariibaculum suncheonense]MBD0834755.1 hypothetical protein [Aestuariibaculum suncheonense]